ALHEGLSLGPPGHRGHGLEIGGRQGRHRPARGAALALPDQALGVTRIDFYRYAEDKLLFACRLAAKAYEKSTRLVVYSPDRRLLAEFDRLLWGYQQLKFIPHCMAGSPVAKETPVILAGEGDELPHHDVLLNLGDGEP